MLKNLYLKIFFKITKGETKLDQDWEVINGRIVSENVRRLEFFRLFFLKKIADAPGGFHILYREWFKGRYWEYTYPHSAMHGLGPFRLSVVSFEYAKKEYNLPDN